MKNTNTLGRYIYNGNLHEVNHSRSVKFENKKNGALLIIQLKPNEFEPVPDWVSDIDFKTKPQKTGLEYKHQSFIDNMQNQNQETQEKDIFSSEEELKKLIPDNDFFDYEETKEIKTDNLNKVLDKEIKETKKKTKIPTLAKAKKFKAK
jgi:hypothetical protein